MADSTFASPDRFGEEAVQARELAVGITEYIDRNGECFQGMLKERWEDFEVREISPAGEVAQEGGPVILPQPASDGLSQEEAMGKLKSIVGEEESLRIAGLLLAKGEAFSVGPLVNKADRTSVHQCIRAYAGWVSETGAEAGMIRILRKRDSQTAAADDRNRPSNSNKPSWLRFCLYKANMDTMDACAWMAARLRLQSGRDFSYAGTKDRRARTWQWITVKGVKAERLAALNDDEDDETKNLAEESLESGEILIPAKRTVSERSGGRCLRVSQIGPAKVPLRLGDLRGNRFTLVIRQIANAERIPAALQRLAEHGFINYFGLQRFGTTSISSQQVGLALLKREWQEACTLLLDPRAEDSEEIRHARSQWRDSPAAALQAMPGRLQAERSVLRHLLAHPDDYRGAVMAINKELRTMYLHAVQSWLWNLMASHRLRLGRQVLPDDLVREGEEVKTVNASNSASLFDVVLPLPGHAVTIPAWAISLLGEQGIDLALFAACEEWHLPGAYRPLLGRVGDLQHEGQEDGSVRVSFSLGTSCYATMAMREILRKE